MCGVYVYVICMYVVVIVVCVYVVFMHGSGMYVEGRRQNKMVRSGRDLIGLFSGVAPSHFFLLILYSQSQ